MKRQLSEEHKARIREGMARSKLTKGDQVSEKSENNLIPDALSNLLGGISAQVTKQIDETVTGEFKELRKLATKNAKLDVTNNGVTNTVQGLRHIQLEELIRIAALRLPVLMVGMAGTGKTHAAEQVAEALGLNHYTMSVGAQTSKSDIVGFIHANGGYVPTLFRKAYEEGGVFLMDEIDAGNANVLIQVNAALSNGMGAFPDQMVKRHPDFIFLASANTYGTGMNRQYVGRNQLDAATLDRFTIVDWDVDANLESSLAIGKNGQIWYETVKVVRDFVAKHNIRALVTPRATQKGSLLLENGSGVEEVIPGVLLGSIPEDKKQEIMTLALNHFKGGKPSQKKS